MKLKIYQYIPVLKICLLVSLILINNLISYGQEATFEDAVVSLSFLRKMTLKSSLLQLQIKQVYQLKNLIYIFMLKERLAYYLLEMFLTPQMRLGW